MGMRRACSYQATIRTPEAPGNYSALLLTIQQGGQNLINKSKADLTVNETSVIVNLTQEETAQFAAGKPALLQLRCFASAYDAPGSHAWAIDVLPALNDKILAAPEVEP